MPSNSRSNWVGVFSLIAFIAVAMIGFALLFARIFTGNNISGPLLHVAQILAYVVVAFASFFYANRRGQSRASHVTHMVIWSVSVILIVVLVILNIL
ncbi:MAG: hypothetical protein FWC00_06490 [Firmicutes bacterium]|nr:hypothetical protein [Bacillota bacterium]